MERHQVQEVLIAEANARAGQASHATRQHIEASLGTGIQDPAHRGMDGDLDAQGGVLAANQVRGVLQDMGMGDLAVREQAGTLEIGDDFALVVHRSGMKERPGTAFHEVMNIVDARNPEIYLSQRMRGEDPLSGRQAQPGRTFVEVQDHLKKAADGLYATDSELTHRPDRMQHLAKETGKVLDMGTISDEELTAILRRHGIDESTAAFRERMQTIKEGRAYITDATEAGRIRDVGQEVFIQAERATYEQARTELRSQLAEADRVYDMRKRLEAMTDNQETRARREALQRDLEVRERSLRDEIVDTRSKMRAAADANAEIRQQKGVDPSSGSGTKTSLSAMERVYGATTRVYEVYGVVTDLADIGNAAMALEGYIEGEVSLSEVILAVLNVPPLSPVGTVVGTTLRVLGQASDYMDAAATIREANRQNLAAYYTDWELGLRRAGLSAEEVRRLVSDSMLTGDFHVLEAKAERLGLEGKDFASPLLVVEDSVAPDGGAWYMWENTKETAWSMIQGVYTGTTYIISAPGSVVTAFGQRELAEATLAYDSETAEANMRTRLYRTLRQGGIDHERALAGVNEGGATLRALSLEVQARLSEARLEEERVAEEQQQLQERIDSIFTRLRTLRFMDIHLLTTPGTRIPIPQAIEEGAVIEIEVALGGEFEAEWRKLEQDLRFVTGQGDTVHVTYHLSLGGVKEQGGGNFTVELPALEGAYPLELTIDLAIVGLEGTFAPLAHSMQRSVQEVVVVFSAAEEIRFKEDVYELTVFDHASVEAIVLHGDETANYSYAWYFRDQSAVTEVPVWTFYAELDEEDVSQTQMATVVLMERTSGLVLGHAHAAIHIAPLDRADYARGLLLHVREDWDTSWWEKVGRPESATWRSIESLGLPTNTRRITPTSSEEDASVQAEITHAVSVFYYERSTRGSWLHSTRPGGQITRDVSWWGTEDIQAIVDQADWIGCPVGPSLLSAPALSEPLYGWEFDLKRNVYVNAFYVPYTRTLPDFDFSMIGVSILWLHQIGDYEYMWQLHYSGLQLTSELLCEDFAQCMREGNCRFAIHPEALDIVKAEALQFFDHIFVPYARGRP